MMKTNSFRTRVVLTNLITLFVIVLCSGMPALSKPSHLYASGTDGEGTPTLYRINVHTGTAKPVNDFTSVDEIHSVGGLAFDTDHGILYATAPTEAPWPILSVSGLYTVDVKTAFSSFVGVSDSSERLSGGLAYDSNHRVLYATGLLSVGFQVRSAVFTVDPLTGAAAVASVFVPYDLSSGGLAYDPVHDIFYATGTTNIQGQSALFVVDVKNHSTTFIGYQSPDAFLAFGGLALDPSTGILYATGYDLTNLGTDPRRSFLYVVDPATGSATKVGPTGQIGIEFGKLTFVPQGKSHSE